MQRVANRVRVSVQLIDARTDAHLWAKLTIAMSRTCLQFKAEIAQAIAKS